MKQLLIFCLLVVSAGLMAAGINLGQLDNYAKQNTPSYIKKDNAPGNNPVTDAGATLGRVLFYDKKLSANNTIACGSCHQQRFAFGDTAVQSVGLSGGLTDRHAMRLVNARFGTETSFFWDERAASLEEQTTQPIRNHVEMGFSGTNGDPGMDSLVRKLQSLPYYPVLFRLVYGDSLVTEERMQRALAQFVRSIQSFDAKYDFGRDLMPNDNTPFPNFTQQENLGKSLFFAAPPNGAGCQGCHRAPEFDINPFSRNNNVIEVAGKPGNLDLNVTRAPTLRDLINPTGELNGPMMHDGSIKSLSALLDHYNLILPKPGNNNLDPRLNGQNLQLDQAKKDALIAFLKTLTGSKVYTDKKWSDPFDANGNLSFPQLSVAQTGSIPDARVYPNPARGSLRLQLPDGDFQVSVTDVSGRVLHRQHYTAGQEISLTGLPAGLLIFTIQDTRTSKSARLSVVHVP